MSKLDELIQDYCPDGVRFEELQSLFDIKNGYTPSKKNNEYWTDGTVPWFRMEDLRKNGRVLSDAIQHVSESAVKKGFLFPEYSIVMSTTATIGEHALITVPFLMNQQMTAFSIKPDKKDIIDIKFFFYVCFSIGEWCRRNVNTSSLAIVSTGQLKKFKIPIPPLEVQKEIVSILDKFTQLEAELSAELSAELDARRKQYDYYRRSLMTPDENVEYSSLQELCTLITDGSHTSPKAASEGYYMPSVKDMRSNGFDLSSCKKISKEDYDVLVRNGCKPQKNDVLIAKDGSMLKYAFPIEEEQDLVVLSSIAILRPKVDIINPRYLAHYFGQEKFKETVIRNYSSKGGVPRIVLKNFKKVKIPVPSLDKQNEIVTILDKFEALMSDISGGLPAEISARRQQHEYYRTKLLTFQELAA